MAANLSGLNSLFAARLSAAIAAAEQATGQKASFISGRRTPAQGVAIWNRATDFGRHAPSFAAARPGKSLHEQGMAVDLDAGPVRDWIQAHAKEYGLEAAYASDRAKGTWGLDPPHIELARGTLKTPYDSTPNAFTAGAPALSPAQRAAAAVAAGQPPAGAAAGQPAPFVLGRGRGQISSGAAVRGLQQQLAAAGFKPGPADGNYGPRTEAAVRAAEQRYGLTRDRGVAGPQVQGALDRVAPQTIPLPRLRPGDVPAGPPVGGLPSVLPGGVPPSFQQPQRPITPTRRPLTGIEAGSPLFSPTPIGQQAAPLVSSPPGGPVIMARPDRSAAPLVPPAAAIAADPYAANRAYAAAHPPPTFFRGPEGSGDLSPPLGSPPTGIMGGPPDPYAARRAYAAANPPPTFFRGPEGSGEMRPSLAGPVLAVDSGSSPDLNTIYAIQSRNDPTMGGNADVHGIPPAAEGVARRAAEYARIGPFPGRPAVVSDNTFNGPPPGSIAGIWSGSPWANAKNSISDLNNRLSDLGGALSNLGGRVFGMGASAATPAGVGSSLMGPAVYPSGFTGPGRSPSGFWGPATDPGVATGQRPTSGLSKALSGLSSLFSTPAYGEERSGSMPPVNPSYVRPAVIPENQGPELNPYDFSAAAAGRLSSLGGSPRADFNYDFGGIAVPAGGEPRSFVAGGAGIPWATPPSAIINHLGTAQALAAVDQAKRMAAIRDALNVIYPAKLAAASPAPGGAAAAYGITGRGFGGAPSQGYGSWGDTRDAIRGYLSANNVSPGSSIGVTPSGPGWHSPDYNSTSGGAIYAYHPDGQGGGTYTDSHGNLHTY